MDTCDRTNALTASALSAIISALSDLSSSDSSQQAGLGSDGASAGINGIAGFGGGSTGAGRQGTPGQLQAAPPSSLTTGSVVTSKVTAAPPPTPPPPTPPAAAKAGRISNDSSSSGVFSPGIHPSTVGRSCRAQAARLKSGEAPARRAKAPSAAWGPASRTATATEVAMALGLNPVTRAGVDAAAEDTKRTTSRAALLGGGVGGLGVDYPGRTGGGRYGRAESAGFPSKAEAPPVSGNRKLSPEEQRQNEAVSSVSARFGRPSAVGAVETAAPFTREVGSRGDGGVKLAANRTAASATTAATAARTTSASRKFSRASTAAAVGAGASTFGRRDDSHRASSAVTGMLASPSGVRRHSDRPTRRVQSGASRVSPRTSSSGVRAALMASPRLAARAGAMERHPAASLSTAAADQGSRNPGRSPDNTAFRGGPDEHVACAFLDGADGAELSAFLSSASSALGSPRGSLSSTRATRRQDLLDLHSASSAGGGARSARGGLGAAPAAAASAARQMRSQGVGRFSMASRGQSESVTRFLAGEGEAITGGDGGGGGGGGDADASAFRYPPGMDADEVRFVLRVESRLGSPRRSSRTREPAVLKQGGVRPFWWRSEVYVAGTRGDV